MCSLLRIIVALTLLSAVDLLTTVSNEAVYGYKNYDKNVLIENSDTENFYVLCPMFMEKIKRVKRYAVKVGLCPKGNIRFRIWCISCDKYTELTGKDCPGST